MAIRFKHGEKSFKIDDDLYLVIKSDYYDNIVTVTFENENGDKLSIPNGMKISILNGYRIEIGAILHGYEISDSGKVVLSDTQYTLDLYKNYNVIYCGNEILKFTCTCEWSIDDFTGL
jgi:hypothetical protein